MGLMVIGDMRVVGLRALLTISPTLNLETAVDRYSPLASRYDH